jgi:hypothetical protein
VNFKNMYRGMLFGALVALVVTFGQLWRERHTNPLASVATAPSATASAESQAASPAQSIDDRLHQLDAQDAWLRRRDLEFDKCAALHGTPVLGFGMSVVCLDSHAVKFTGEHSPPYKSLIQ